MHPSTSAWILFARRRKFALKLRSTKRVRKVGFEREYAAKELRFHTPVVQTANDRARKLTDIAESMDWARQAAGLIIRRCEDSTQSALTLTARNNWTLRATRVSTAVGTTHGVMQCSNSQPELGHRGWVHPVPQLSIVLGWNEQ